MVKEVDFELRSLSEDSQMKSAQILEIKATVQDQINANTSLRQQIEILRADKVHLQREIQQLQQGLEESKNSQRVRD